MPVRSDVDALLSFLRGFRIPHTLAESRSNYDTAAQAFPLAAGFTVQPWELSGLTGERIEPRAAKPGRAILYLHGGGYVMGSSLSHRHLGAAVAERAGAVVYVLDYRRAPEHPFPAAFDDTVRAYKALAEHNPDERFALAGDSAGGGLALSCAAAVTRARECVPAPVAVACVSAWTDLSLAQAAPDSDADPVMILQMNRSYAESYLAGTDARDPRASPLFADLSRLPPTLLQVGSLEQIYLDSARFARAGREQGADVTLEVTEGAPHVWPWFWPRFSCARRGVDAMGEFLNEAFEKEVERNER